MNNATRYGWFALIAVGVVLAIGCPQQGADRPATYAVSGQVTQGDEPVAGATVTFVPTGSGKAATGITDESGNYTLTTFKAGDGAVPGTYGVKIVKFEGSEPAEAAGGGGGGGAGGGDIGEQMPDDYGGAAEVSDEPPANLLPSKFESPDTSELEATVTEDPAQNVFDFDVSG